MCRFFYLLLRFEGLKFLKISQSDLTICQLTPLAWKAVIVLGQRGLLLPCLQKKIYLDHYKMLLSWPLQNAFGTKAAGFGAKSKWCILILYGENRGGLSQSKSFAAVWRFINALILYGNSLNSPCGLQLAAAVTIFSLLV